MRRPAIRLSTRTNRVPEGLLRQPRRMSIEAIRLLPQTKRASGRSGRRIMTEKHDTHRETENGGRRMRLRAALRENLKRRKSQSRGRTDQAASAPDPDPEHRDE